MDYDRTRIPETYDRSRDHGPEVLALWMDVSAKLLDGRRVSRILDLGCGTGRFTHALASRFDAEVIGVDPSARMLERARAKQHDPHVRYAEGRAEAIPLESGSVDMIFMSMSFHHFADKLLAARECRRVLRQGGMAFLRTGVRERSTVYPYVPFFPSTPSMIEELLPSVAELRQVFEAEGFRLVTSELITQTIAPNWDVYADKVAAGGDSVISRLDRQELEVGLERMRAYAATAREAVVEPIDLLVFE